MLDLDIHSVSGGKVGTIPRPLNDRAPQIILHNTGFSGVVEPKVRSFHGT